MKKKRAGFTIIELMIALAIVSILAAIGYPSYLGYITKSRRSDGQVALLDLAHKMERYFTVNNTYAGATLSAVGTTSNTTGGYYTLSITSTTATTYNLQAIPAGSQTSDTTCSTLTLNQLGQKGSTGSDPAATCWQ